MVSKAVSAKAAAMSAWVSLQPSGPSRDLNESEKDFPSNDLFLHVSEQPKGARRASIMGLLTAKAIGTMPIMTMRSWRKSGERSWARMMAANTTTNRGRKSVILPKSRPRSSWDGL